MREEDAEPLLRGRQPAERSDERSPTQSQSRLILLVGGLVACVLWLLPPLDALLAPAASLESLLPLTHRRQQSRLSADPHATTRAAAVAPRRGRPPPPPPPPIVEPDSSAQPPLALALALTSPPQRSAAAPAGRTAQPRALDLVFGVVAFRPDSGCTQSKHAGKQCDRSPYYLGLRRWVRSVRMQLPPERADVLVFTGAGKGSLASDEPTALWLRQQGVRLVEAEYADSAARVARTAVDTPVYVLTDTYDDMYDGAYGDTCDDTYSNAPGPPYCVRTVRATRTSLLRAARVRTGGAGPLAHAGHCCTCTYAVRLPASGVLYVPRTVAPQALRWG